MKLPQKLLLAALFAATLFGVVYASTAQAKPTNQVLVLTTATRIDLADMYVRRGLIVQNHGPNTIWCSVGTSAGLAVNYGTAVLPGESATWPIAHSVATIPVYCIASANQVAGAATDVTEF